MSEDLEALWAKAKPTKATPPDDLDALWLRAKPAASSIDPAKSAIGGAYQGVTMDFGDELGGLIGKALMREHGVRLGKGAQIAANDTPQVRAAKEALAQQAADAPTNYELVRDLTRKDLEAARQANPEAFMAGQIAGGVASTVAPGAAVGRVLKAAPRLSRAVSGMSPLAQVATGGAAYGATSGAGASEADSALGVLGDAALGATVGAGAGAIGRGLGKVAEGGGQVLRKTLGRWAERGERAATQQLDELAEQAVGKKLAGVAGKLGGETQKGNRIVENLMRLEAHGTPEQKLAVKALRESGAVNELQERLLQSTLEDLPGQKGSIDALRAELAELTTKRPELLEEALRDVSSLSAQVKPRLQRYAAPLLGSVLGPSLGAAAGVLTGESPGSAAVGAMFGAGLRPSQRALTRMVQHPAVKQRLFRALQSAVPTAQEVPGKLASDAIRSALPPVIAPSGYAHALAEALRRKEREDATAAR